MDDHEAASNLGLVLAVGTGTLYAASANLVSYVAHKEVLEGPTLSKCQHTLVETVAFCGYVVGGLMVTAAYACGTPVPIANATMVATNLVANMIMQWNLGITMYNKSMRVGTLIFLIAVFQLCHVGPAPRGKVDVKAYFSEPEAEAWFVTLAVFFVLSLLGTLATQNEPMQSWQKIASWACLIGIMGSGTDNGASTFGLLEGWVLYAALLTYCLVSFVLLLLSSRAPGVCEASVYVPLQLCLQLVLNMITGFLVWRDNERLEDIGVYLSTFALCLLGVYLTSDRVDVFAGVTQWQMRRHHLTETQFGNTLSHLLDSWKWAQMKPTPAAREQSGRALKDCLTSGVARGVFDAENLVDLAVSLEEEIGASGASVPVVQWIEDNPTIQNYVRKDASFEELLRETLSESQRERLRERPLSPRSNVDDSESNGSMFDDEE